MDDKQLLDSIGKLMDEKIGTLRDELKEEVRGQVAPLRAEMGSQMDILRKDVADQIRPLRESLTKLEAVPHQLELLAETQQGIHEKLDNMQGQVNSLETKMENSVIVKAVTPSAP